MNRMKQTAILVIALLITPLAVLAQDKPNVLLIMADDFVNFCEEFTKDVVKTPNFDRLCAHGPTFERAYVQYPVCNPSRCSMMSGLRAEQTGIVGNDVPLREHLPDIIALPQLCKEAGWDTHAFGKLYHLGRGMDTEARQRWIDAGRS
jgi:arylsulfatase A-like enzyme